MTSVSKRSEADLAVVGATEQCGVTTTGLFQEETDPDSLEREVVQ